MTSDAHPDRLSLLGMRFEARHGVHKWERETPQPFEVDLVLHADLSDAAGRDSLEATVDYGPLFELVRTIVEGPPRDLIETLAGEIARAVLSATEPRLVGVVDVRVRKPKAPIDGAFDTVEVALTRRRD
jgi:dihydroneopterin aldolase